MSWFNNLANTVKSVFGGTGSTRTVTAPTVTVAPPTYYPLKPPIIAPVTPPAPKAEGTALTFGQQYQVETIGPDGKSVLRTVSLSTLQSTPIIKASGSQTSAKDTANAARMLTGLMTPEQISRALDVAKNIDSFLCLKSSESVSVEYNAMQTPNLNCEMVYNFFTNDEADLSVQENDLLDPLLKGVKPARYIKLTWQPVNAPNPSADFSVRTQEENNFVSQYLTLNRGVTTGTQQVPKKAMSEKHVKPITKDGLNVTLVDTHDQPRGFDSTSNNRIFKDSVLTVLNVAVGDGSTVPLKDLLIAHGNK